MKAHQRIIREQKSTQPPNNLFGDYWNNINTQLSKTTVRETTTKTAKKIIEEYEWLGCLPAVIWHTYGIFFDGICGGVVVFGPEYSENLGVWDKYGYTNKMILLSRGACEHWTPKNTASKLITEAIKLLPPKYEIVTATIDPLAGEVGKIYQACNWDYVGCMRTQNKKIKNAERFAINLNGKIIGTRSLRQTIGSQRWDEIKKRYPTAKKLTQLSKFRYFFFRGTHKQRKKHREAIHHLVQPYPKSVEEMNPAGKVSRRET